MFIRVRAAKTFVENDGMIFQGTPGIVNYGQDIVENGRVKVQWSSIIYQQTLRTDFDCFVLPEYIENVEPVAA